MAQAAYKAKAALATTAYGRYSLLFAKSITTLFWLTCRHCWLLTGVGGQDVDQVVRWGYFTQLQSRGMGGHDRTSGRSGGCC